MLCEDNFEVLKDTSNHSNSPQPLQQVPGKYVKIGDFILWLLLIGNLAILTRFILFKEPVAIGYYLLKKNNIDKASGPEYKRMNLALFATIQTIANSKRSKGYKYKNIGGNVIGFIPLGILLPSLLFRSAKSWKTVLTVLGISLLFESTQLYTGWGVFDIDDLFLNSTGGILGYILYGLLKRTLPRCYRFKHKAAINCNTTI